MASPFDYASYLLSPPVPDLSAMYAAQSQSRQKGRAATEQQGGESTSAMDVDRGVGSSRGTTASSASTDSGRSDKAAGKAAATADDGPRPTTPFFGIDDPMSYGLDPSTFSSNVNFQMPSFLSGGPFVGDGREPTYFEAPPQSSMAPMSQSADQPSFSKKFKGPALNLPSPGLPFGRAAQSARPPTAASRSSAYPYSTAPNAPSPPCVVCSASVHLTLQPAAGDLDVRARREPARVRRLRLELRQRQPGQEAVCADAVEHLPRRRAGSEFARGLARRVRPQRARLAAGDRRQLPRPLLELRLRHARRARARRGPAESANQHRARRHVSLVPRRRRATVRLPDRLRLADVLDADGLRGARDHRPQLSLPPVAHGRGRAGQQAQVHGRQRGLPHEDAHPLRQGVPGQRDQLPQGRHALHQLDHDHSYHLGLGRDLVLCACRPGDGTR